MKRKKNIIRILAIGSLFLISAVSFTGVISIQDSNLYSFWNVKKINYSFVTKSYAEDHEDEEDDYKEYKRKTKSTSSSSTNTSGNTSTSGSANSSTTSCHIVYDSRTTASGVNVSEPVQVCDTINGTTTTQIINNSSSVDTAKIEALTNQTKVNIKPTVPAVTIQNPENVSITVAEKNKISVLFLTFKIKLNKTNYTDSKKLLIFKKVDVLINEKINTLNKNILTIKDYNLLQNTQKKVLLLKEVQANIQSQIVVYLDAINTKLQNDLVAAQKVAANIAQTKSTSTVTQTVASSTSANAAAQAAAQKAAQTAAANAAAQAAAQKAAQTAAANAAAQAAAQKAANTTTSAS
ncbi:MAG: hypothetical protein PHV23_02730 [Candidatus Gracilibacteria bacterium]|nr:hypothetical protein [Candidatus Gracilibacteria bacterium]